MTDSEDQFEKIRRDLCLRKNFNIEQAFRSIDAKNKGYLVPDDIKVFLTQRYHFVTDAEVGYLMFRFDKINCG